MSNTALLLFISIIPIILILLVVYNKDKNKEPIALLLKLFLSGIISCFLVLIISDLLSKYVPFMTLNTKDYDFWNTLLYAFIGVAFIEELCKWFMVYVIGYNNKEFDEIYDIIVYSVFVSLGFAFFENIVYVFSNNDLKTALLRAISAIPGHACNSVFMGYYLSLAKQYTYREQKDYTRQYKLFSILVPTAMHGIYDFCLMSGQTLLLFVFLTFIIFLYAISIKKLKQVAAANRELKESRDFCPYCGNKLESNFCNNCGRRQE